MKKMKENNKLFVNYKFFLLSSFLLLSCQVIPSSYDEILIGASYWCSIENIETSLGTESIIYTQTFNTDKTYYKKTEHPTTGTIEEEYYYSIGYQNPKYAIVLYNLTDSTVIEGTPIYFYFDFENMLLVTSTNSNMAYARKWIGIVE